MVTLFFAPVLLFDGMDSIASVLIKKTTSSFLACEDYPKSPLYRFYPQIPLSITYLNHGKRQPTHHPRKAGSEF
jgi:hypothetical protein